MAGHAIGPTSAPVWDRPGRIPPRPGHLFVRRPALCAARAQAVSPRPSRSRAIPAFSPLHAAGPVATLWDGTGLGAETPVATPFGPVPAGRLRRGDQVLGPGGAPCAITECHHLVLPRAAHRRLGLPAPVLLAAGALGFGLPAAPLWLGAAQRLRLDGGWVAAGLLGRENPEAPPLVRLECAGAGLLASGVVLAGAPGPTDPAAAIAAAIRLAGGPRRLAGFVDHADRAGLRGWALDPADPARIVALEAVADGVVLARGLAQLPRPDLRHPDLSLPGGGRHGFALRFAAPLPPGRPWLLHLRPAGGGPGLPGSPLLLDPAVADPARFDRALAVLGDDAAEFLAVLVNAAARP